VGNQGTGTGVPDEVDAASPTAATESPEANSDQAEEPRHAAEQTAAQTEDHAAAPAERHAAEQTAAQTEDHAAARAERRAAEQTAGQAEDRAVGQTQGQTAAQTEDQTAGQAERRVAEQTAEKTAEQTEHRAAGQTQGQTAVQTEDRAAGQAERHAAEKTAVQAEDRAVGQTQGQTAVQTEDRAAAQTADQPADPADPAANPAASPAANPAANHPTIPHPRRPLRDAVNPLRAVRAASALRRRHHPLTLVLIAATTLAYAALAYRRRWIADDGMIAVRTVRQILAGNGPLYSPYERAETDTSTLWTALLTLGGGLTGIDVARVAVYTGLLCAVGGVLAALFATARLHARLSGKPRQLLVPAGALVLLGVSPFWDFATSGLETGLEILWLGLCWLVLVVWCAESPDTKRQCAIALLIGLALLVRPEFTLLEAVFGVAAWLLIRPGKRRTLLLFVTAQALPLITEILRAGYYGELVPLPALAKSASGSQWNRGWRYVEETLKGYFLWIPLAILLIAAIAHLMKKSALKTRTTTILLATPVVAGLLLGLYVIKVGGDFMHARMVLPVVFLLVLPVLLVPVNAVLVPAVTATAVWAAYCGSTYSVHFYDQKHAISEDERLGYQQWTGRPNPDTSAAYTDKEKGIGDSIVSWTAHGDRVLTSEGGVDIPLNPDLPFSFAVAAGRLGAAGAETPLADEVVDTLGLANPLGAHLTVTAPGRPGHEKELPWAWILADYGDPAVVDHKTVVDGVTPEQVSAARHAMSCGGLKELLDSTRQPMTLGRFWNNLTGSPGRTALVVPADPFAAEKKFCG
jgi:arabinofuranosyltransferase